MRNLKKLCAAALALVMCMALSVPAFAANGDGATDATQPAGAGEYSITVNKVLEGHTYTAYKLLDLEVNDPGNPTAFSYYVDEGSPWYGFFADGGTGADYVELSEKAVDLGDGATKAHYVTWKKIDSEGKADVAGFAAKAEKYIDGWNKDEAHAEKKIVAAGSHKVTSDDFKADTTSTEAGLKRFTFTNLAGGYYLIASTAGSHATIGSTPGKESQQINEKNVVPTLDKNIKHDDGKLDKNINGKGIGDTVNYQLTVVVPSSVVTYKDADGNVSNTGAENYAIHDKMSAALTLNDGIVVNVSRGTVVTELKAGTHYDVLTGNDRIHKDDASTNGKTEGCAFEIKFKDAFLDGLQAGDVITVDYSVTINEKALAGTFGNTAWLRYGDPNGDGEGVGKTPDVNIGGDPDPDPDPPDPDDPPKPGPGVNTFLIKGYKFYASNDTAVGLSGAKFKLYKAGANSDALWLVPVADIGYDVSVDANIKRANGEVKVVSAVDATPNYWRIGKSTDAGATQEIVLTGNGGFVIMGLGSGDYELEETKAPDGYNKLADRISFSINPVEYGADGTTIKAGSGQLSQGGAANTIKNLSIENVYGTQMPETGGIGTTIFYIIGGICVVVAIVFLVSRKRAGDEDDDE